MKKVAVILSGCGVYDGSEIHEACAALLALDRLDAQAVICAPRGPQMHTINHLAGEPESGGARDILEESARLARGEIKALDEVDPLEVDAVLLPGGFGAAKNLCNFATEGARCTVHPQVEAFLKEAHQINRPIGAMCIAPVILARIFGKELAPRLTIGTDRDTALAIGDMGAQHVDCPATETVVDQDNKLVTTPAYMSAGRIGEVFDGALGFVEKLLALTR
jgi:enhancing lycopene biosynthesis protein 2|nr:isoprenoid biosynthesis glyoxalase ElbB [Candidatus Krumholzibacteria bacterium]